MERNGKLLSYKEVLERLEKRGIKMSRSALKYWRDKGFIPEQYYVIELHGTRKYFYYKPEVIDYIVRKIHEKAKRDY